jgi:transposase-like protein
MASRIFTAHAENIASAIADAGLSLADAARQFEVAPRTVERWLARGREDPNGPYGSFTAKVTRARVERTVEPHAGTVSQALTDHLGSLDEIDGERAVQAALAESLARGIDGATELGSAAALAAMPRLAAQLSELLPVLVENATDEAERRRLERMLAPLTRRK